MNHNFMKTFLLLSLLLLLSLVPGGPALAAETQLANATNQNLLITARTLSYDHTAGIAIYKGDVRVEDPEMIMNCGLMTIRLQLAPKPGATNNLPATNAAPAKVTTNAAPATASTNSASLAKPAWEFDSRKINSVDAEQDVVIFLKKDKSKASGDKAVFTSGTGKMELTGNSYIETENGYLVGDVITWDRNGNTLNATNPRTVLRSDLKGRTNRVVQPAPAPAGNK